MSHQDPPREPKLGSRSQSAVDASLTRSCGVMGAERRIAGIPVTQGPSRQHPPDFWL